MATATKEAPAAAPSPFVKSSSRERRIKCFVYGGSGSGKTSLGLCFPSPVVIDLEQGTDAYGDEYTFDVLETQSPDDVLEAVKWLRSEKHDYRTLVLDPITVYWEALQRKWSDIFMSRNRTSKGHKGEFYDFQVKDWNVIKGEFKTMIRALLSLDMNVVVTARQKAQYADGDFMRQIGETFDGEKSLPYLFDVVLHLFRPENAFSFEVLKDRTRGLPTTDVKMPEPRGLYGLIEKAFGAENAQREAKPVEVLTPDQAGELRKLIEELGLDMGTVSTRLLAYGADKVEDLSRENAAIIIEKLSKAVAARRAVADDVDKANHDPKTGKGA